MSCSGPALERRPASSIASALTAGSPYDAVVIGPDKRHATAAAGALAYHGKFGRVEDRCAAGNKHALVIRFSPANNMRASELQNLARQYVPDSSIIVFGAGAAANIQSTFLNVGGAAEAAAADVGDAFGSGFDRLADGAGTAASALKVALVVAVVVALAYAYKQIKP